MASYDPAKAVAWIAEETGDPTSGEDSLVATGLFVGHVESGPLETEPRPWTSEADAYPTGSRAAEWNAKLGAGPGQFV